MNHHLYTNCEISASSVEKIVETKTEFVGKVSAYYSRDFSKKEVVPQTLIEYFYWKKKPNPIFSFYSAMFQHNFSNHYKLM